ncbi:class I SAM-dependent methyltransferase [bacterium]|nr:class I SAM-dependent methyltransferase [bacterium]
MTPFDQSYFSNCYRDYALQNPPYKLAFYMSWVERLAPAKEALDILEVGCGLGSFLRYLHDRRPLHRLTATDISDFAVAETAKRTPSVDIRRAPADCKVFPDASFDCVCSFDVCEHVPDLESTLQAVADVLRPGGIFLLVVPVYDGLSGPLIRLLDKDPTHVHKMGRDFWLNWGRQRLQLLDWVGMVRYLLPWKYYLHLTTRRFRRHTPAILAVFRK